MIVTRLLSAAAIGIPAHVIGAPSWVYATVGCGMVLTLAGLARIGTSRRATATTA